jgi:hypothetical protein
MLVARGPPACNQIEIRWQAEKTEGKEIKPRSKARKARFQTAIHT